MKIFNSLALAGLMAALLLAATPVNAGDPDYRSPENVEGAVTIDVQRAKEMFDEGAKFIDVRSPRLYARRHIPGVHHLDLKHVFDELSLAAVAKRDEPIVIYCSGVKCSRSSRASEKAVSWGYSKVFYFRGGIADWRKAGHPLESQEK